MRCLKLILLSLFFLFSFTSFFSFSLALDNLQSTSKILMTPYYRASMVQGTNYTYLFSINPPDKISKVLTALVSLQIYINPTVTISAWVNNTPCNTPLYTVSTSYAGASQALMTFDCTNAINKAGSYIFKLLSSKDTGVSTAWLDVTYNNNQTDYVGIVGNVETVDNVSSVGTVDTCKSVDVVDSVTSVDSVKGVVESKSASMDIHGTEYTPNDPATMFVQLRDSDGLAISNGACYLNIWSPLNSSGVHPVLLTNAPMLSLGSDGVYYYDMFAPNQLGVHMLSADCEYSFNQKWIYPENEYIYFPIATIITGTWTGGNSALNSRTDDVYEKCDSTATILCQSTYVFNLTQYGPITNLTSINLYFAGQGDNVNKIVTFAYWNGTTYVNLPNIFTVASTGASATVVGDVDIFVTNTVPLSAFINNQTVTIRYTGQTGLARLYNNWLSLSILSATSSIQDIRGSGEMHITNVPSASSQASAIAIWNYTNRNLTYYPDFSGNVVVNKTAIAEEVWSWNGDIVSNILEQIANKIWEYLGANAEIIS